MRESGGRQLLSKVLPETRELKEKIKKIDGVQKVFIAGSIRRRRETIGDIDIIVTSEKSEGITERFAKLPEIAHIYGKGETKVNARLKNGLDVDLRVVPSRALGAALNYFTGSKAHNIELREMAQKKDWKLNEYGLWSGKKFIGGETEENLYKNSNN